MHDLVGAVRVCELDGREEVFAGDWEGVTLGGANAVVRRVERVMWRCVVWSSVEV